MSDTDLLDAMSDAWAPNYGLTRFKPHYGATTLGPLFRGSELDQVRTAELTHAGDYLLDHSRAFKPIGPGNSRPVAIVSAPYEHSLRQYLGNKERVVQEIYALADALHLRVRIGHPADRIYDSTPRGRYQVLPIVWWDPTRLTLVYPPFPAADKM